MQKIKFSRTELKNHAATALLTAAPLSVMLLSAIYNLAFGSFGYDITSGIPVLLSCLTVIALIAGTVLAAVYKKRIKNRLRKAEKACIDLLRRRYKDKNHSA